MKLIAFYKNPKTNHAHTNSISRKKFIKFVLVAVGYFLLVSSPSVVDAAACSQPGTTYGTDTMNVSVQNATTYTLWVRMQAPSTSSNSIMLQVNGNTCFNVGGSSSIPVNSWTWVDYQNGSSSQVMKTALSAGNNSFELIGTQPGVSIDVILALGDPDCVPTGFGTNCTTGQPTTTTPPTNTNPGTTGKGSGSTSSSGSSGSSTSPGSTNPDITTSSSGVTTLTPNNTQVQVTNPVVINPTYSANQTIKEVEYYLNNKKVYTATKAPFTYYLNTNKLLSGKYVLTSDTIYTSGSSSTGTETIIVKHSFFKNVAIFIVNYIILLISLLIVIGIAIWFYIKYKPPVPPVITRTYAKARALIPFHRGNTDGANGADSAASASMASPNDNYDQPTIITPTIQNETPTQHDDDVPSKL